MIFGKLLYLPAGRRQTPVDVARQSIGPNHLTPSQRKLDVGEGERPASRICRERIDVFDAPGSAARRLRSGEVALCAPLDAMGRALAQAETVADVIKLLQGAPFEQALRNLRRISLTAATGQIDVQQFQTVCGLMARNCPRVEQLDVADAVLSPAAIASLASLSQLQVLALNVHDCAHRRRAPLPDTLLEQLAQAPRLHTLMLGNANLPERGVAPLANLATLRSLSLSNCAFNAHDVESIGTLHRLEAFFHRGEEDCAAVARVAAQLIHLETLFLAKLRNDGRPIDIGPLRALLHLRRLHVDEADFGWFAGRAIGKSCRALQELCLHAPFLSSNGGTALAKFTGLHTLRITGDIVGNPPSTATVLALRKKHRLRDFEIPARQLSAYARHEYLRTFGTATLDYRFPSSDGIQAASADKQWLMKQGILEENTPFPAPRT